jgi:hypothetical protein
MNDRLAEVLDVDALRAKVEAILAEALYWFPVRHHSPAVARHLREALRERRPRVLFLEGPAEAAAMIPHVVDGQTRPPVAIYSSYRDDDNVLGLAGVKSAAPDVPARFSVWFPMLPYSPEYVAMCEAERVGAEVVFIDLPHHALIERARPAPAVEADAVAAPPDEAPRDAGPAGWENLVPESGFYARLAEAAGYRTWEEAWDAIFEVGDRLRDREAFRRDLAYFCAAVRATTPPSVIASDGTLPRERHMWTCIREEMARRKLPPEQAMVACGGFHLFLDRDDPMPAPVPPPGTVYVTVAPYSYFRTSELAGYAAGNRAPLWYERLWDASATGDGGPEGALVEHVVAALSRARKDGESVSSADAIAASQHARMLAALRGRPQPVLDDVRDAIVTCCCKGRPSEEGGHLLRALAAAEIGTAVGRVTPKLGRLPLLDDFYVQIAALELGEIMGRDKRLRLSLDKRDERARRQSVFLHRLAHLEVPLGERVDVPTGAGPALLFRETWQLHWSPKVEDALVQKVLYGDTLEAAAAARLEEELALDERHAGRTCERLVRSLDMDLPDVVVRLEHAAGAAVDEDKQFVSLAQALTQLLILARHAGYRKLRTDPVDELRKRCYGHACLEIPGIAAAPEEEHEGVLHGLVSVAEAVLAGAEDLDPALFVENLRKARHESPSAFLRGAFTGLLSEIRAESPAEMAAHVAGYARQRPEVLIEAGGFLDGVMAASRTSILLGAGPLVDAVDELLRAAAWDDYLAMLPRLRHAFERLHERQRVSFCDRVAEKYGLAEGADAVARLSISAEVGARIARIDARVAELLSEWDL